MDPSASSESRETANRRGSLGRPKESQASSTRVEAHVGPGRDGTSFAVNEGGVRYGILHTPDGIRQGLGQIRAGKSQEWDALQHGLAWHHLFAGALEGDD
jgi:hypothetical protein